MGLTNAHEGYDYQDLLTSYFILKEILEGNNNSIFYIDKKHTKGKYTIVTQDKEGNDKTVEKNVPDRFDDLVIVNGSNIQRKQIKFSNDNVARKIIKSDFANDSKGLALYEIYKTWEELKTSNSEFRLCLAWDKPEDHDIKDVLTTVTDVQHSFPDFSTQLFKINLSKIWKSGADPLSTWSNFKTYINENSIERADFETFCNELVIEIELPKASLNFSSPGTLENIVYKQIERLRNWSISES